jgi:hypothetical protein
MKQSLQGNNLNRRRYHGRIAINRGVVFGKREVIGRRAVFGALLIVISSCVRELVEVVHVLEF